MIKIKTFVFNPFMENSYLLYDDTGEGMIIDPGCYEKHERDTLLKFIDDHSIKITALVNTHCHIDHVLGNQFVKNTFNIKLSIHKESVEVLKSNEVVAPAYGLHQYESSEADILLSESEMISFGKHDLEILYVPGHAPGHIALFHRAQGVCICGDVIFQGSIGRTDLPGGDMNTLLRSIHDKIFPLGDQVVLYPGHGPKTEVGIEKISNPFCRLRA
jgi:glyoxylase-like metal-dependent hydrolase (beta-lactamase superfamily II)